MIRLHVVVEGQTEETFVNEVLAPELIPRSIYPSVRCVLTTGPGSHPGKGGGDSYKHWRKDIERSLKAERRHDVFLTTMVDLYRLPDDFPGRDECASCVRATDKVTCLEEQFRADLNNDPRFIPYIQLHEYEALLFADPTCFQAAYPGDDARVNRMVEIRQPFDTVDEIDEGDQTAPSKRIISVFPEYAGDKPTTGVIVALEIGLERMLAASPHFRQWVERLRNLKPLGSMTPDATP